MAQGVGMNEILKDRFRKQAQMMRDYAYYAETSPNGKFRGVTAEEARKLAAHHEAIAKGEIKMGTPCEF